MHAVSNLAKVLGCLFVCLLCFFGGKKPEKESYAESKDSDWTTCSNSDQSLPCSRFAHDCNFYVHRSQNSQYYF